MKTVLITQYRAATLPLISILAACGGGGNSSSGGATTTPATYTIGGDVSGLGNGAQVTLQNNGTDTLTVSSNGAFMFSAPILSNGSYAITVSNQPTGQTCAVSGNGSGAGVTANISNITIVCSTTFYVSTTGSDSNNGLSTTTAFATIQHAAGVTQPGDTVEVMAGTYYEDQINLTVSGTSTAPITYTNYLNAAVILDFGLTVTSPWTVYAGSGSGTIYSVLPIYGSGTHHWPTNTQHVIVNSQILSPVSCPTPKSVAACIPLMTAGTFYSADDSGANYGKLYIWPADGSNPNSVSVTIMNSNGDSGHLYNTGLYNFAYSDPNNNTTPIGVPASNIIINGLTFQGGESNVTISDTTGTNTHQNFILQNCEIKYAEEYAVNFGNWDGATINHCDIHHNGLFNYPRGAAPGVGWPSTIVGYGDNGNVLYGTTNITIENSTVHDNNGEGISAGSYWNIKNNTFYDNYSINIYMNSPYANNVGQTVIDSNFVYNTGNYIGATVGNPTDIREMAVGIAIANEASDNGYKNGGSGTAGYSNVTITNNILYNSGNNGIQVLNYQSGPFYLTNSTIAYNTVGATYNNSRAILVLVSDNVIVANNLATQNAIALSGLSVTNTHSDGHGIDADNNMVASASLLTTSSGNSPVTVSGTVVNSNPEICGGSNPYSPNYFALQTNSPALGAGSNAVASTVLTDFFGQSRQGTTDDIGAVKGGGCNH